MPKGDFNKVALQRHTRKQGPRILEDPRRLRTLEDPGPLRT